MKKLKSLLIAIAGLGLAPLAAHAQDLSMTLTPATLTVGNGGSVTFTGSVANPSGGTVFMNGDSITALSPGLTADGSLFFQNAPLFLPAGAVYPPNGQASLFTVSAAPGTADGFYSGYFNILGGADSAAQNIEATEKFTVQVVPEPSTLASLTLLTLGTGLMVFRARRRRIA